MCAHSWKSIGTWVSSIFFLTSWVSHNIIHLAYISWVCTIQSLPGPFVEDTQTALIPYGDCEQRECAARMKETQGRGPRPSWAGV